MTENKYHNGKIYKIVSTETDKVYYGSTTNALWSRFSQHKRFYRMWKNGAPRAKISVYDIFDNYGIDTCRIVLVEEYKCENKNQLLAREQYHIDRNRKKCQNNYNAYGANHERRKATLQKYLMENKEKVKLTKAKYRADNKDRLNKHNLEQYHLKKDDPKYMEQRHNINAKWRAKNAEYDKARKHEWGNQLYHCDVCNVDVKRYSKSAHEKTENIKITYHNNSLRLKYKLKE